jgi:hypothetical protein
MTSFHTMCGDVHSCQPQQQHLQLLTVAQLLCFLLLLLLLGLASRKPFMNVFLVPAGLPLAGGGKQLGCCVPALSVTAAVRQSPSCRPAVPMMLSANCTACSWSGRLLKGGGASA